MVPPETSTHDLRDGLSTLRDGLGADLKAELEGMLGAALQKLESTLRGEMIETSRKVSGFGWSPGS